MNADEQKKSLRKDLKAKRDALDAVERATMDARLTRNICGLPEYASAHILLPYLSFGSEVDTRAIIARAWEDGKEVALPRCIPGTREMAWHRVDSLDGLIKSPFGVDEPADDPATRIDPLALADFEALVLVPGFAFDARGYRLGYGGGFYDAFLARCKSAAAGLCREVFFDAYEIATGPYDLPVTLIVTDERIVRLDS